MFLVTTSLLCRTGRVLFLAEVSPRLLRDNLVAAKLCRLILREVRIAILMVILLLMADLCVFPVIVNGIFIVIILPVLRLKVTILLFIKWRRKTQSRFLFLLARVRQSVVVESKRSRSRRDRVISRRKSLVKRLVDRRSVRLLFVFRLMIWTLLRSTSLLAFRTLKLVHRLRRHLFKQLRTVRRRRLFIIWSRWKFTLFVPLARRMVVL